MSKKLILRNTLSLGDNIVMTSFLREFNKKYPNKFKFGVFSYYPEVYENNPYVHIFTDDQKQVMNRTDMIYLCDFYNRKTNGRHFAQGYITHFNNLYALDVQLTDCRPEIYLTEEEITRAKNILNSAGISGEFWLISPSIKPDIPLKSYPARYWEEFTQLSSMNNIQVIQTGHSHAINPRFRDIVSLVGKTDNIRDYFAVCYLSKGMIGYPSAQMHISAAFNKPCIVIAGGREDVSYNAYHGQHYLHSIGYLPCCKHSACWLKDIQACKYYKNGSMACMDLITPSSIMECVLNYEKHN